MSFIELFTCQDPADPVRLFFVSLHGLKQSLYFWKQALKPCAAEYGRQDGSLWHLALFFLNLCVPKAVPGSVQVFCLPLCTQAPSQGAAAFFPPGNILRF